MPITESSKIWMDGSLVDWKDANVHVLSHGLHYGSGVFEGIRAYSTDQGPAVFRLQDHVDRFFNSAKMLLMEIPFTNKTIFDAIKETVHVNGLDSCYIRPIAFLGYGEMGLNPLMCKTSVSIAVWPWGTYLGEDGLQNGIRTKVSSWQRHDPNSVPPAVKCTGMYVNSSLAKVDAIKSGYDECILLNPQGEVAECTGENIFVIKNNALITPPISSGALDGITRDSIMRVASDMGYQVKEQTLLRSDLYIADEAFLTGTAAEVVPIASVDDREIGSGKPGEMTKRLQNAFFSIVRGENGKYKDWLEYVV
jgi:branched-chain amino acid aminotransferase